MIIMATGDLLQGCYLAKIGQHAKALEHLKLSEEQQHGPPVAVAQHLARAQPRVAQEEAHDVARRPRGEQQPATRGM